MFLPISTLIVLVVGIYLVGLITIPIIALVILRKPSRLHANTKSNGANYATKNRTRSYGRN